jgi:CheY-like chemotaxis protein
MKKIEPLERDTRSLLKPRHRVLYVEDVDSNFEVAELRLQRGYEVIRAADDRAACQLLRTQAPTFIAILMDIQLQGSSLDGIDLARVLRGLPIAAAVPEYARGLPRVDLPLLFVTACTASLREQRALDLDADACISKPLDFLALNLVLTRLITSRTAARRSG